MVSIRDNDCARHHIELRLPTKDFDEFIDETLPNSKYESKDLGDLYKQKMPVDKDVYLGFGEAIHPSQAYRLKSHFFPLGKIGGKPSWLNPKNLPSSTDLACRVCKQPMSFLLQIYCTNADDPQHAFHRSFFIFLCKNKECSIENDSSNLKVFRCQLPQVNDYYPTERMFDPDMDSDVDDPMHDSNLYPHLCEICGCHATKKCSKCNVKWYCCKEHQIVDWRTDHSKSCGTNDVSKSTSNDYANNIVNIRPLNECVFKEYEMEIDIEYLKNTILKEIEDIESSGNDVEEEDEDHLIKQMKEMNMFTKKIKDINPDDVDDMEEDKEDISFKIFHKLISINPDQILRYKRKGIPLIATDLSPFPKEIPKCNNCGAERTFEFQLMPYLLDLIDVTCIGKSIDWASVYIYSCSKSCEIKDQGYFEEFLFKQDFILSDEDKKIM
uniref:MYND-type domain-containing protein n=1 Tax=Parastrongyloides trichosuri TaxID=131310 RepID=A0A0N5A4Z3_PARTI